MPVTDAKPPRRSRFSTALLVVVLVASGFVIAIGVQAYLSKQSDDRYDACIADFNQRTAEFNRELAQATEARSTANAQLDEARDRKDKLLDAVIVLSLTAQQKGWTTEANTPPAVLDRYERLLVDRVDAQQDFDRLKAEADTVRKANPIPRAPRVNCVR